MTRNVAVVVALAIGLAGSAAGQAITGFSGGSESASYYGSTVAGDTVGFRFTVSSAIRVTDLGNWNQDANAGGAGLTEDHQVGLWDGSQALLASATVGPAGTPVGNWTYVAITPVDLAPGQTYTLGAVYPNGGTDNYVSGASGVTSAPEVTWLNGVYPTAADLGFADPGLDSASTSGGRSGPNLLFGAVPVELMCFSAE